MIWWKKSNKNRLCIAIFFWQLWLCLFLQLPLVQFDNCHLFLTKIYDCFHRAFHHISKEKKTIEQWKNIVYINISDNMKSKQIEKYSKCTWIRYHGKNIALHSNMLCNINREYEWILYDHSLSVHNCYCHRRHRYCPQRTLFLWLTPAVIYSYVNIHHLSDTPSNIYFILYVQPNITICHP